MEEGPGTGPDDWMGVWGKQSFPQWSKEEEAPGAATFRWRASGN